ncbi:protein asteroid homolog 1 [Morone saxatilis]|uniref:protein asteroid homolog 1 n=1 Tax=Morone saxatilis TaxID=34816 RepID=UPI0015E24AEB|nr:protein asteroid homolog 1 [Morone saxatilis]XP_035537244.1 protein asteroid homolog 1 [Morone saxatilis]
MGVHGLTTYVEGNRHLLQDVKFRDSLLVIDGCSLYFRLYFNNGLDQQHGGDYDTFARLLSQFLSALAACNIQPYVVLDGGLDPSDKKFSTLRQRQQSKIRDADSLSHGRNGSVLPLLTRNVFIQVLMQRGVPLVQCPAEADWEIACLAHQWKCPVLTNDSDFYIFDLPGGYLPLRFFQWTNLNGKASHRYISARCYTTKRLCGLFGGINQELLPLCAVLTGNDYSAPKDAETLLDLLNLSSTYCRGGGRGKGSISRFEGILLWLSSFSHPKEALEEVSKLMGEEGTAGGGRGKGGQKGELSSQLWAAMQEYRITPQSTLARWFSEGKAPPGRWTSVLPEYLSLAAAQGLLSPFVVDAAVMHRVMLIPQVENSRLPSSHCSARAIRQAVYEIVLQRGPDVQAMDMSVQENIHQGMRGGRGRGGRARGGGQFGGGRGQSILQQGAATVQAQGLGVIVEEYDRLDLNLKKNQVEAHLPKTPIHLDTLGQAPAAVRLGVLLDVLGVRESALAPVPLHLRLAVAVTGFWLREAKPTPSQLQLQALVLGMVYGEISWNSECGATHSQHAVPQQNWAAEHNVWAGLNKIRVRPGERRGLDVGVAHSFSQWQACLWSALSLNQLLLLPMPEPHLSWLFSGTLLHGLLRHLIGGRTADSFFFGGSLSGQLYSSLLEAVVNCISKTHPYCSAGRGKRGGGRGRRGRGGRGRGARGARGARGGGRETEEINNRFALLMNEEEYDDY